MIRSNLKRMEPVTGGSGAPEPSEGAAIPDPEVPAKAKRRLFTAQYKRAILAEADACSEEGAIGELLRREGLYWSHLSTWRRQREEGTLQGLTPKKRGRKSNLNPLAEENRQLRTHNARLARRLEQAELIIEVQKKVSALLGIVLPEIDPGKSNS